ncbi:MAG: hypothetical protein A2W01_03030 [Candidatus Solincola sediminis]|nr:MAG: hypothetical protein A2W01_03030 [Candidatus Solincola sediminis]
MKGLLVYHSKWGNAARVAEQIARGLRDSGTEVTLLDIKSKVNLEAEPAFDFLIAGSPTRVGNMTSPMKRFLKNHIKSEWEGKDFAAFGTGLKQRDETDKKSAERIHDVLESKGLRPVALPFKGTVEGMKGPLAPGELERALDFGQQVAAALAES